MPHPVRIKTDPDDVAPAENPSLERAAGDDQPVASNPTLQDAMNDNEAKVKVEVIEARRIFLDDEWIDYWGNVDADGKPHGKGKIIFGNGDEYEGDLVHGNHEGKGKYKI